LKETAVTVALQGYTRDEIRDFVHEYYLQPHGTKTAWLASRSVTKWTIRQWRRAVFEGDLDRNLVPRDYGVMAHTHGDRSAFEKARAKEIAEHQSEIEQLKGRIRELEGTNDALGKAIGLLHGLNVPEPDTKRTNDPKSS
jgi:transposase-like protein